MDSTRGRAALAAAVVGLALVIIEAVQTLRGDTLGTLGAILLYGGLALFVIASAVLITEPRAAASNSPVSTVSDAQTVDTREFDEK